MADVAVRRAPVARSGALWQVAPPLARFALRVDGGSAAERAAGKIPLALTACRSETQGEWSALWLGPDEQLLIGPEATGEAFAARIVDALAGVPHSLVDISHRQGALLLTGPKAADLINAGCPLDLHLSKCPVSFCTRTVLAKSEIVLWRRAAETFHVEVWRSFLPYVTGLLAIAAEEHGA